MSMIITAVGTYVLVHFTVTVLLNLAAIIISKS